MKERRHEERIKTLQLTHVVQLDASGNETELTVGRTLDLSRDGVRLEMADMVPIRSFLKLTLAVDDRLIEVKGQVTSHVDLPEGEIAHGLQFVEVSDENRQVLDAFLKRKSVAPPKG